MLTPDLDILFSQRWKEVIFPRGSGIQAFGLVLALAVGSLAAVKGVSIIVAIGLAVAALLLAMVLTPGSKLQKMGQGLKGVQEYGVFTASRPLQRWGPFGLIWMPYRALLFLLWLLFTDKQRDTNLGHRHPLSHWPVLADAVRWTNLAAVSCLVLGAVLQLQHRGSPATVLAAMRQFAVAHPDLAVAAFAGCCLATALHQTLDQIIKDPPR